MNDSSPLDWLSSVRQTVAYYRKMVDAIVEQLDDAELFSRPATGFNSVAILLRHIGGNLRSRWTDFRKSDGEKPDRNRDSEFLDWEGDRESLLKYFDQGWTALERALESMDESDLDDIIYIRGEAHSIPEAVMRSVTHTSYHVGQIAIVGRMVHKGDWRWLTVSPGGSADHNKRTWGSSASRKIPSKSDGQGQSSEE